MKVVTVSNAIMTDPDGHALLSSTRTLLPIKDITVTVHSSVTIDSKTVSDLYNKVKDLRLMESGSGYWMGLHREPIGGGGLALVRGQVSFSQLDSESIGHEFGHNLSLYHAPSCDAGRPDLNYPHGEGHIGSWGYDFNNPSQMVDPTTFDIMGYCFPKWISDYSFNRAVGHRTSAQPGIAKVPLASASPEIALFIAGGTDSAMKPYLEPVFVMKVVPSLPQSPGPWQLIGATEDGDELFFLTFSMLETADGDGSTSFAFTVPVQPGWDDMLASVTLAGPGGSFTLDGEHDDPRAIVIDEATGKVTGFLDNYDPSDESTISAMSFISKTAGGSRQRVLFSRGIPDSAAWNGYIPQ